jgi:peptide deformylase
VNIVTNIEILHQKSILVADKDISKAFSQLLSRTIYQRRGAIGFAGNQVGLKENVFSALLDGKWRLFANAKIIRRSWSKTAGLEECLSLPDKEYQVKRYNKITIRYQNAEGETLKESFEGFNARVIQHEIDHLNGILISDTKSWRIS